MVWIEQNNSLNFSLFASRYTPTLGWGIRDSVGSNPGDASNPAVAIDSQGHAFVVWIQTLGSFVTQQIWSNDAIAAK